MQEIKKIFGLFYRGEIYVNNLKFRYLKIAHGTKEAFDITLSIHSLHLENCIDVCPVLNDNDNVRLYHSCKGCDHYVSCSGGTPVRVIDRPCALGGFFDYDIQTCDHKSNTCIFRRGK